MLTNRMNRVQMSKTMAFTAKANALKAEGISVMDFSVGEPDFDTPEHICKVAVQALRDGHTRYTPVNGIAALRKAISEKLEKENGILYTPDQICVGTGAKQPLFNALFAICEEGDEVIVPTPCWVSYEEMIKLCGATPVLVPACAEKGFSLDLQAVEAAVTEHTKGIIINTPNNPTGAVYTEEELRGLARLAGKYQFYIVSDEVYEKLVYEGTQHVSVAAVAGDAKKWCITVNGFSKSFAMTGWRCGYVAAEDEVIAAVKAIQSHTTSSSNSITQYAALEALQASQQCVEEMRLAYEERRNYILSQMETMPYVHCTNAKGAFYLMFDISELIGKHYGEIPMDSTDRVAELFLTQAHVAMVSGAAFRAEGYLRMCYAASLDEIREGMDRLRKFMENVR